MNPRPPISTTLYAWFFILFATFFVASLKTVFPLSRGQDLTPVAVPFMMLFGTGRAGYELYSRKAFVPLAIGIVLALCIGGVFLFI